MATTLLRPDQSFYPSPRLAAEAPVETLAYMVTVDPTRTEPDGLVTLDVDAKSKGLGKQIGRVEAPNVGDEFHHFGWNVCSSALCPYAALFFFKQKTAYEIDCDWSSDVCSSD